MEEEKLPSWSVAAKPPTTAITPLLSLYHTPTCLECGSQTPDITPFSSHPVKYTTPVIRVIKSQHNHPLHHWDTLYKKHLRSITHGVINTPGDNFFRGSKVITRGVVCTVVYGNTDSDSHPCVLSGLRPCVGQVPLFAPSTFAAACCVGQISLGVVPRYGLQFLGRNPYDVMTI